MSARFTAGSMWGWDSFLRYGEEQTVIDARVEGDAPAAIALTLAAVRGGPDAPGQETDGLALLEWGSSQGSYHRAEVDVGRGDAFTVMASAVRVTIRNVGAAGGGDDHPTRRFRAHASFGGGAEARATRAVRLSGLATGIESPSELVPPFAAAFTFPRYPQVAARVRFIGGGGNPIAEYHFGRSEDRRVVLPAGAERVLVVNDDGTTLTRGQVQFELQLR